MKYPSVHTWSNLASCRSKNCNGSRQVIFSWGQFASQDPGILKAKLSASGKAITIIAYDYNTKYVPSTKTTPDHRLASQTSAPFWLASWSGPCLSSRLSPCTFWPFFQFLQLQKLLLLGALVLCRPDATGHHLFQIMSWVVSGDANKNTCFKYALNLFENCPIRKGSIDVVFSNQLLLN